MIVTTLTALVLQAQPADMAGQWEVALYFSADAPPSQTTMVLEPQSDGGLTGSFYGSTFEVGRVAQRGETLAFTAVTSDGSGQYLHSGRLNSSGVIDGQTLSVGRDFLMLWTAARAEGDAQ